MVAENAREYLEQMENEEERQKLKYQQALEELKQYLNLDTVPFRIEAFDISNTQGVEPVASMVVLKELCQKKRIIANSK